MNYHSDDWIMYKVNEHKEEALNYFDNNHIVGIFLQGSQNYGLDYENSDVDTKLITLPTLEDLVYNNQPISTTHVRENDEHIDFKDIRLYMRTFEKQNLNFLEILFTPYKIVNALFEDDWNILVKYREDVAHLSMVRAVKAMSGVAWNKYKALTHPFEGKLLVLQKYGYDPKQLHHLIRVKEFIDRYIAGDSFEAAMSPSNVDYLKAVKEGLYSAEEAQNIADITINYIDSIVDDFSNNHDIVLNKTTLDMMRQVQYNIITKGLKKELI